MTAPDDSVGDATVTSQREGDTDPREGTVLGAYRLLDLLGQGGMGRVYLAEHVHLGRRVAIKLLRAEQAERRSAVARFFQEARIVNKVRHRNIVDVPDLVELPDGTVFIVMELLPGRSLRDVVRGAGRLDPATTIAIGIQIGRALEAAHAVGVLHRDLKPANVHVADERTGDAWVKLLDFGIAKLSEPEAARAAPVASMTGEGAIVGTPTYMSPEQASSAPLDPRSDLYSLGVILYELLAGRPPFQEGTLHELIWAHCTRPPVPVREVAPGPVPPALDALIGRLLAKTPGERPASATEVREALEAIAAAPAGARRARGWIALGAAGLAAAGVAVVLLTRGGAPRAAPPAVVPVDAAVVPAVVPVDAGGAAPVDAGVDAPVDAPPPSRRRGSRGAQPGAGKGTATGGIDDPAYTVNPFEDDP